MIRCKEDIIYFTETYCIINDPQTFEQFSFALWDFQKDLLKQWQTGRRFIILKGRQLGISWLLAVLALHTSLFYNNSNTLMLSKREDEAQKLLSKVKFMYRQLPEWLKGERPKVGDNMKDFKVERHNNRNEVVHSGTIVALPATEDAGRSETASLVIADEWAYHKFAETNWTALSPTIDSGGKFIGVSTANGLGNYFHKIWKAAERARNNFTAIFLPYNLRPGRDDEWYNDTLANYTDQRLFHQEYPRSVMEAFITTGGCIFDLAGLQWLSENTCDESMLPSRVGELHPELGRLLEKWPEIKIWSLPRTGESFVVGVDPAGGDDGSDYSAAYILNQHTMEQVAILHGRLEPETFAGIIVALARVYNDALLVVERNNHGHAVLNSLHTTFNYGNLFKYRKDKVTGDGDNKFGFITTTKTKPIMESILQSKISARTLKVHDMDFVFEAQSYVRKPNGRTGAESSAYDDRVSAMMLALIGCSMTSSVGTMRGTRRRSMATTPARHFRTRHI